MPLPSIIQPSKQVPTDSTPSTQTRLPSTPLSLTHSQIPHLLHYAASIPIPNTIVFSPSTGIPEWLFYAMKGPKSRRIMRKHAFHVTNEAIWSAIVGIKVPKRRRAAPDTIVVEEQMQTQQMTQAQSSLLPLLAKRPTVTPSAPVSTPLDRFKKTSESVPCALVFHWHQDVLGDTHFSFDVLNARRLDRYLETQHKRADSIEMLQQFVQPKGEYDNFIRVLWTYKVCLMDKYVNKHKWNDPSVDITKRISILSENLVIGSEITHEEQLACHKMCDMLVAHINKHTKKLHHLSHLAFTCKQDKHGVMHFLWFDAIRTTTEPVSGLVSDHKQDFKLANILYAFSGDFVNGWPSVSLQTAAVGNSSKKKRRKQQPEVGEWGSSEDSTPTTNAGRKVTARSFNSSNTTTPPSSTVPSHYLLSYVPSNTLPYVRDPHSNSIVHSHILQHHQQIHQVALKSDLNQTPPAVEQASSMFDSRLTLRQQSDPVCSICEKRYDISLQHHLEYDSILKYHERKREKSAIYDSSFLTHPMDHDKSNRTIMLEKVVPPEIFRNEPNMTVEDFREARGDVRFLNKTLEVCEQCHQRYVKAITSAFALPQILRSKVFARAAHQQEKIRSYSVSMRSANETLGEYHRRSLREKRRFQAEQRTPYDILV